MWKHISSDGSWKSNHFFQTSTLIYPSVHKKTNNKGWNHRNWKNTASDHIKITHHPQFQRHFNTRQFFNVKEENNKAIQIKNINWKREELIQVLSDHFVFFTGPPTFPGSQSLPHFLNLASAHTHSTNSSPLHYFSANQMMRVMQGVAVNHRQGPLQLQTHIKLQTERCLYTRKCFHKALNTQVMGWWGQAYNYCVCYCVLLCATVQFPHKQYSFK